MPDEFYAVLMGAIISIFLMIIIICPICLDIGKRDVLDSLHPCKKGMLIAVDINNEHWICANEKWSKQ